MAKKDKFYKEHGDVIDALVIKITSWNDFGTKFS